MKVSIEEIRHEELEGSNLSLLAALIELGHDISNPLQISEISFKRAVELTRRGEGGHCRVGKRDGISLAYSEDKEALKEWYDKNWSFYDTE